MLADNEIRRFFATVDSRKPDDVARWFAPSVRLRMGSNDWIEGHANVRQAFAATSEIYSGVEHAITGIWRGTMDGYDVAAVEAVVTYTLPTGETVDTPCTSTLRFEADKIFDYRIYLDPAPLDRLRRDRNEASVRRFLSLLEKMDFDAWALLFCRRWRSGKPLCSGRIPAGISWASGDPPTLVDLPRSLRWHAFPKSAFSPGAGS